MIARPLAQNKIARAAFWMVLADAGFVGMMVCVRYLSFDLHIFEIVFLRSAVAIAVVVPAALTRAQRQGLRTERLGFIALRGAIVYAAMLGYFWAIAHIPLADAVSLQFLIPLFTLVGAAIFLGEKVGVRRAVATAIGFAGALIILRPGFAEVGLPAIAVLVSAALYAQNWLMIKSLTRTDSPKAIVFYINVVVLPIAFLPALFVWSWPAWSLVPLIVATGLSGWCAQMCQARGFASADTSVVAVFDFLRLPMTAALGWFLFEEGVDLWTWTGAIVIFAAATHITRREARLEGAGAARPATRPEAGRA
jgi:drug/metabolite transporter (DMT)-like permease